ncbi:MAG: phosphocholine cytidylyltransferase family protein [Dehalococcoidia bacterium]|nr:MAG: phosphocholine cytidylyltransferase family protein [Dehalococcoidia bacterium]
MVTCDICGALFKTAQGLAGHKRLRHGAYGLATELGIALTNKQLHRKVLNRLGEKLADRLAEAILQSRGQEILDHYLEELSQQGLDLRSLGRYRNLRAIIVAAGESNRLLPLTQDKPECLLEIGNKTILSRELENLRACGIHDIVVVRGYQGDKIKYPAIRYYENRDYQNTGILRSLFYAEGEMDDEFIFCYSDILYTKEVLELLLRDQSDISLVVDTDWESHYHQRRQHPVSEAELVRVEGDRITQIGRNILPSDDVYGEFIGLAKFSKKGAEILRANYEWAIQSYKARAFHRAPSLDKAYFTDMIQELLDQGYPVCHVDIRGGWAEIDTMEDFDRVSRELRLVLKVD